MTPKLQGRFRGCPHHGDDYEACIQYSGTAPCGVEEERDALAAHVERLEAVFLRGFHSGDEHDLDTWEEEAKTVLASAPTTSLARQKLLWGIEMLDELADTAIGGWEDFELQAKANHKRRELGVPVRDYDTEDEP